MSKQLNQVGAAVVSKPDYEIFKHPVYYIHFNNEEKYDAICSLFGYYGVANGDGQFIISAASIREQLEDIDEEEAYTLRQIVAVLDKAKFDGDVWFYIR